jgi:hypothetical protein
LKNSFFLVVFPRSFSFFFLFFFFFAELVVTLDNHSDKSKKISSQRSLDNLPRQRNKEIKMPLQAINSQSQTTVRKYRVKNSTEYLISFKKRTTSIDRDESMKESEIKKSILYKQLIISQSFLRRT